ncbi:MAG: addiction module toxin RelE [Gammaproteobacteria bacterium]|nr:addiction module toxin RelE [Gammaproteobacteria bacterium]
MARSLRLEVAGATYLISARSVHAEVLFGAEADHRWFLDCLGRSCLRYRWRCLAWCLTPAYYQLILVTEEANLSTGMRHLNSRYAQALPRRKPGPGQLFEGRYEAIVVDRERYLVEAVRRVLLAPLREGLASTPGAWPWSSYGATLGHSPPPDWLAVADVLAPFAAANCPAEAFGAALVAPRTHPFDRPQPVRRCLGDSAFFASLLAQSPRHLAACAELPRSTRWPRPALTGFAAEHPNRREAMRAAYACGCYTQKEIARYFGVHAATVSRAVGPSYQPQI